jgi:hypothetical protein
VAHDVFISYSTQDKPTADAACAALERGGIRVWMAPRDVEPGADWGEAIVDAIAAARVMVLVLSARSNDSPQVRREVQHAFEHDATVIPLRVEDVTPRRALQYYLGSVHWLDALTPPLEAHLARLVERVRGLLASSAGARSDTPAEARAPEAARRAGRARRRPVMVAAAVAVALTIAGLAAYASLGRGTPTLAGRYAGTLYEGNATGPRASWPIVWNVTDRGGAVSGTYSIGRDSGEITGTVTADRVVLRHVSTATPGKVCDFEGRVARGDVTGAWSCNHARGGGTFTVSLRAGAG